MDQFFYNHYVFAILLGIVAAVAFLIATVVAWCFACDCLDRSPSGQFRNLGISLAVMILTGVLAFSGFSNGSAGEAAHFDRENQIKVDHYSELLSDRCNAATVDRFREIAVDYQGARSQHNGPRGAYQEILIQGGTTDGM